MPYYAPADRVVEVIGDYGQSSEEQFRLGSGCLVAGRAVLTAAHVVAGARRVIVRDARKQILPALWTPEAQDFVGTSNGAGPDLALVELADPGIDFPPLPLARINRSGELDDMIEGCVTIGYPLFAQRPADHGSASPGPLIRDTAHAWGRIAVHSMRVTGFLSLTVSSAPRDLPLGALSDSEWSGMSGAPVIADGCLVGAVTEHAPRQGTSTITVTPITALEPSPDFPAWGSGVVDPAAWWRRLGAGAPDTFPVLPQPRRRSPYLATVREIHIRNGLIKNRERKFSELVAFAEGNEGYRLLVGEQYAGKTALLAELVSTRLPRRVDVVSYFVSGNQGDADRDRFLAAAVPQLAELLGRTEPEHGPQEFRALWQEAALRASRLQRHLLLVVDGLDEDLAPPGSPSIAELLPAAVAGLGYPEWHQAHVLVSNRLNSPLPGDIPHNHPLRKAEPVVLTPHAEASVYEALARQEIDSLKAIRPEARRFLAALAAAAGPLGTEDLRELTGLSEDSVDELVKRTQRSLRATGSAEAPRYAFASASLLQSARADSDLRVARYREAIHDWAERWRRRRWQRDEDARAEVPLFLLDAYPKTLGGEPQRRAALVGDAGWVTAAIEKITVDLVLAELRTCVAATPGLARPARMLAVVRGQAPFLRSQPGLEPGQVLRQLCLQAAELDETDLATDFRERLAPYPGPIPAWTSRRPHRALVAEINGHAGWVNAVVLMPDGNVVAGTDDGRIWIWNPSAATYGVVTLGRHEGPVRALAVDTHGRVVSGGHDHRIRVWDPLLIRTDPVELGQHDGAVRALAIDGNGRVISGGDDGRVLLWDEQALEPGPVELGRHAGAVRSVAVGPDGLVVSGGDDHRARLWGHASPGVILAQTDRLGGRIMTVAIAPDRSVVVAGTDSVLYRWRHQFSQPAADVRSAPAQPAQPAEFGGHHGAVRAVAVAREDMVISGGDDGRVLLWRPGDRGTDRVDIGHHDGPVRTVTDAPDDRAVSGGQDQRVRMWDLREPGLAAARSGIPTGRVNAVCISADGCVVTGGRDTTVWLWESAEAAAPVELGRHNCPVAAVASQPGGRTVSCGVDGRLLQWDRARPGEVAAELGRHEGAVLCTLTTGRVVSGGYDGQIRRWDAAQGRGPVVLGICRGPVAAVAALDDGRVVTGTTAGEVSIWDPDRPGADPVGRERYGGRLNALAVVAGHVVGGGDDGGMWIWDLAGGKVTRFSGHAAWLTSLAAFRNGYLISGGADDRMVVWACERGRLRRISVVACSVRALAAGPVLAGEGRLAVAHAGSGVSYWTLGSPDGDAASMHPAAPPRD